MLSIPTSPGAYALLVDIIDSMKVEVFMFALAVGTCMLFSGGFSRGWFADRPLKPLKVSTAKDKPSLGAPATGGPHAQEGKAGGGGSAALAALQPLHGALRQGRVQDALQHFQSLPACSAATCAARLLGALARLPVLAEDVVHTLTALEGRFDSRALEVAAAEAQRQGDLHACHQLYRIAGLAAIPKSSGALESLVRGHLCDPAAMRALADDVIANSPSLSRDFRETLALLCDQAGAGGGLEVALPGALEKARGFAKAISSCGKEGHLDKATGLFAQAQRQGLANAVVQNCLLDACVECEDMPAALKHFAEMKASGSVDVVSYNTVMKGLSRVDFRSALGLLSEMSQRGLTANRVTYHGLLNSLVQHGGQRQMWDLLDRMHAAGHAPNAVTCSIMLKGVGAPPQLNDLKRILAIIDKLEDVKEEGLFASVVEACHRVGSQALLIVQTRAFAQRGGLTKLSAPTCGVMIKAFGQAGDVERIWGLWQDMIARQVIPTPITLGCMVEALVMNGCAEDAWEIARTTGKDLRLQPSDHTIIYSTLIKGFSWSKQYDKVAALYLEMKEKGIPRNAITYNTILNSMARCGQMSEMMGLLEDMRSTDPPVEPDIVTYSTIIKGYCQSGDLDKGLALLKQMRAQAKIVPDEVLYNSLLDGCARQHRLEEALGLLDEMRASSVVPSNYTLSIACKLLGRARRLPQAFSMVETLSQEYGFQPNIAVYTCLIQACFHNRQLGKALALHDQILREGVTPDEKTYTALAQGCLTAGAADKAAAVVRCAHHLPCGGLLQQTPGRPQGVEAACVEKVIAELGRTNLAAARELEADLRTCARPAGGGSCGGRPRGGAVQRVAKGRAASGAQGR